MELLASFWNDNTEIAGEWDLTSQEFEILSAFSALTGEEQYFRLAIVIVKLLW
jgi:hypothetical protein